MPTLFHATTTAALAQIKAEGLRVDMSAPGSKLQAVWLASSSNRAWTVLHTLKKHAVTLEEVVVLEVHVPQWVLTRFRRGFYYSLTDISPEHLGIAIPGSAFGVGVSDE